MDKNEVEERIKNQFTELGYKINQFWFNYGPKNEVLGFGCGCEKDGRRWVYDSAVSSFVEY